MGNTVLAAKSLRLKHLKMEFLALPGSSSAHAWAIWVLLLLIKQKALSIASATESSS